MNPKLKIFCRFVTRHSELVLGAGLIIVLFLPRGSMFVDVMFSIIFLGVWALIQLGSVEWDSENTEKENRHGRVR